LAFQGGSGHSSVLVDHAAQDPLPADRSVEWDDGGRVVVRWPLVATLVRPVIAAGDELAVAAQGRGRGDEQAEATVYG
jgi:hypothetical protein